MHFKTWNTLHLPIYLQWHYLLQMHNRRCQFHQHLMSVFYVSLHAVHSASTVRFVLFWRQDDCRKEAAGKLLVKLTASVNLTNIYSQHIFTRGLHDGFFVLSSDSVYYRVSGTQVFGLFNLNSRVFVSSIRVRVSISIIFLVYKE